MPVNEVKLQAPELLGSVKMFAKYMKRPLGLILLLIMVLMGFEAGTKRPLCISSNIVNKIDRVSTPLSASSDGNFTESIYACASFKIPKFSNYFYENLEALNARLSKIEKIAGLLGLKGSLDVEVDERTSGELKLQDRLIKVSADRFEDADFDKLFLSSLLEQNMKSQSVAFNDFLSGWLTEDIHAESVMAELWQDSYNSLSLFEKFKFKEVIFSKLRQKKSFEDKSVTENMMALLDSNNSSVQSFKNVFTDHLKNFGLTEGSSSFDLVYQNLTDQKLNLENLTALAREHKDKRILFQDKSGSYILPYMIQLTDSMRNGILTNLRVVYADSNHRIPFEKYFGNTERLIVFNAKTSAADIKFSSVFSSADLTKNEVSLLHDNKDFDVIQFHVPSLKFRQAQLGQIKDYFGLLKDPKASAKKSRLGWDAEVWSNEAKAFKPVAIYDVIQYYRIN